MFNSIKWRFTIIYFILIFIALTFSGIFIVQAFEEYHLTSVEKRLDDLTDVILSEIENLNDLNPKSVQKIISNYKELGFDEEIYMINNEDLIIATSTENVNKAASDLLDLKLLISAKNEETKTAIADIKNYDIRTMDRSMPVYIDGKLSGILFIRYNLNEIYLTLSKTTMIIVQTIVIATAFTIVICFIIARTISEPIEDISKKALLMSDGDFSNRVEVKSNDEIGDLATTFNLLTDKLQFNINEVFKEKNKMETIIEYMNDGLVAVDLNKNIIHINSRARQFLNVDNCDIPLDCINEALDIDSIIENNELIGIKNVKIKQNVFKVDYLPFKDEEENEIGLVFVISDITESEKLEKMRKDFVANVSHELKTPLTSIKSYSETLVNDDYDKEITKKFLNVINTEADRMARLVKDLLKLSNFDASFDNVDIKESDWVVLIENILLKLKPIYQVKDQEVDFNNFVNDSLGKFDYDKMEQVIINILSNAIKYTQERGKIVINLKNDSEYFMVEIIDDGMGIPDEDLDNIFNRFYRVDKARSRKLGGTGLGLAIAKEIVEMHNGKLIIKSKLDIGTKATLFVPKYVKL
ncbi:ATP-binding protein [Clostridiaceae bacterium HSG29]|nr:ATP-binding protein [Clostridiaceae bacterium HSG29]